MIRTVLLATDDGAPGSPYAEMRPAALRWAADAGARVILYDRSAESYFVDPYPSGPWTADVEGSADASTLLEPGVLTAMGRAYLAEQVSAARAAGVDAYAWLPTRPGPAGMAEAVELFGADVVVLPQALASPSLLDRVRGNTVDRFRGALSVDIALGTHDAVVAGAYRGAKPTSALD